MIITKNIKKFIIYKHATAREALNKIKAEKMKIIIAVDDQNKVAGLLTMGDILRWVVSQDLADLNISVDRIINKNFKYCYVNDGRYKIGSMFEKGVHTVPVVDKHMTLVAVACAESSEITIGTHAINETSGTYIIAEIGNNHNGSYALARKLVDEAVRAGADCVKFQMRNMDSLYLNNGNCNDPSADLGTQYTLDLLSKNQLTAEEMGNIFEYARDKGVEPLCTPWDEASVDVLEKCEVNAYKIASADLTNHDLLRLVASTRKPMICSTGMSTEKEICDASRVLKDEGAQFVLLHCNSTYPAPFRDVNLRYMNRLGNLCDCYVGYSGHERGIYVPVAAVAMGAKVIEKHITLDRSMEGNDHKVSLLPDEFAEMVSAIRVVEESLGQQESAARDISQGEMMNRETLGKSVVASIPIPKGTLITDEMLCIRSPGKGLPPYLKTELIGSIAKRSFASNDFFYASDLESEVAAARDYAFSFPWGIPVRFHDWNNLASQTNLSLLEFHLSYKDLELEVGDYLQDVPALDYVVHCPELFAMDHLLDLCSDDEGYRKRSIEEFKRVAKMTIEMGKFFPSAVKPRIVTNIGGFSDNSFVGAVKKTRMIENFKRSLDEIRSEEYDILPQTMPPFPWHFGGQRFHNVFVEPDEISSLCKELDLTICLDVSHSQLACNHMKWSMEYFLSEVMPYTSHLHIADAEGVDGEGLQIGDGSIDFALVVRMMWAINNRPSFIPEIWQGHKNGGEGFWTALDRLERYFAKFDLGNKE